MTTLKLEITSFTDTAQWEWRLEDAKGKFLADHAVKLDEGSSEYEGFVELHQFVRWNEVGSSEQDLVARIAQWIRKEVWGPVGDAILSQAEREPVTVHLVLPAAARGLLFLPLELGLRMDGSPAASDVSLVYNADEGDGRPEKRPIGDRLRMLGIFSMPTDQAALNVRRERHELARLMHRVARTAGRAVELRILQYGVTRGAIEEVLDEGDGWDLIHFSGHGLPAGLVLEHEDGSADVIKSDEIADLLWPNRAQLKLVTLSACESGAAEAAYALRLLGVESESMPRREVVQRAGAEESSPPLPAVAQSISSRIGCATLAMRYPVEDEFAIELSAGLYESLIAQGQTLPRALQRALEKTRKREGRALSALSLATPGLFGAAALDLKLSPPSGEPMLLSLAGTTMAEFPLEPENFVGRVGQLARASAALAPRSPVTTVLFHGMAGAGKTACALELAYRHRNLRFEAMAWYAAPTEEADPGEALSRFAARLQAQINGLELAHVVDDKERLEAFLPRLRRLLADHSLLLVIDNIETLLTPDGRWRDPRWEMIVSSLISHDGLSRLVLTSRIPPVGMLADPRVRVEPIHSLSASESVLLARQMPNLSSLMLDGVEGDLVTGRQLVRRTLQVVQGNPKLIELADAQAANPEALKERIGDADQTWSERKDLDAFFATGEPAEEIVADDFLQIIQRWADTIAEGLSDLERTAFQVVCCMEDGDRDEVLVEAIWSGLADFLEREELPALEPLLSAVTRQGLLDAVSTDKSRRFVIHPAVEGAALESVSSELRAVIDEGAATVWIQMYDYAKKAQNTPVMVRSCLGAAPYLLRHGEPGRAASCIGIAIAHDPSIPVLALAMPLLRKATEQAVGTAEELTVREVLLRAMAAQQNVDVIPDLRKLIELAEEKGEASRVENLLIDLFNVLMRLGHLVPAGQVLDEIDARQQERGSQWSVLGAKVMRLQLQQAQGASEEVLAEVAKMRQQIEELEEKQKDEEDEEDAEDDVLVWSIKETLLDTGVSAALALRNWKLALELNEAVGASEKAREAPPLNRAITEMNSFGPLVELGRLNDAEKVLINLRVTLEKSEDLRRMGEVFGSWAILESRRGHHENAAAFELKALRHNYLVGELSSVVTNHHNLASGIIEAKGDPKDALAHRLAAALIAFQIQGGDYPRRLFSVAGTVDDFGFEHFPSSFAGLCAYLDAIDGCKFSSLFAGLPTTAPDGEAALQAVRGDVETLLETKGG